MFDDTDETPLALRRTIDDLCRARDNALSEVAAAAEMLQSGYNMTLKAMNTAKGAHGDSDRDRTSHINSSAFQALFPGRFEPQASIAAARKVIDARTWAHLLHFTGLERLMDLDERRAFDTSLAEEVPEVTADTVRATLQRLNGERDLIFKRGIANVFSRLDRRFRSHNGFKIGGRIILTHAFSEHGSLNWSGGFREMIIDIERVFNQLDGGCQGPSILDIITRERPGWGARQSEHENAHFRVVRVFQNGNCHLWFRRDDLVQKVNRLIADYYGDVIPDGMDERAEQDVFNDVKLTPAKRYGFFPSPDAVVSELFRDVYIKPGQRVLEPSAGQGAIARVAVQRGAIVDCIEIQPEHADSLRSQQIYNRVTCGDFNLLNPGPVYDHIIMNPPFDRGRDIDHVMHAFDCLKPGGTLTSVMHAGIEYSETRKARAFRAFCLRHSKRRFGQWGFRDLPPCSFAEVGTRVNTVIVSLRKPTAGPEDNS